MVVRKLTFKKGGKVIGTQTRSNGKVISGTGVGRVSKKKSRKSVAAEEVKASILITDPEGRIVQQEKQTIVSDPLKRARSRTSKPIPQQIKQLQARKQPVTKLPTTPTKTKPQLFSGVKPLNQQIKQTTTKKPSIKPVKGAKLGFGIEGTGKIKRQAKGEFIQQTPLGLVVVKKDGTLRALTAKERREVTKEPTINLNPVNIVTGFFGASVDIARFIKNPGSSSKEIVKAIVTDPKAALEGSIEGAIRNPFGFAGETAAFGAGGKVLKVASKTPKGVLKKVRQFDNRRINQVESKINKLEKKGVNSRQRTKEGTELKILKEEKVILEKDLVDLDRVIKTTTKPIRTKKAITTATKEVTLAHRSFRSRSPRRKKIQVDRQKLLESFAIKQKPQKIKATKSLPKSKEGLVKLLEQARKESGTAFSKLKKKIEKETGLKVKVFEREILDKKGKPIKSFKVGKGGKVQKKVAKKIQIKILEPKKAKGQSKKQPKPKVIDLKLTDKPTPKVIEIINKPQNKQVLITSKKGQAQLKSVNQVQKRKIQTKIKNIRKEIIEFNQGFRNEIKSIRQVKDFTKQNKKINQLKVKRTEQKQKLKTELNKAKAELQTLKKLITKSKLILPKTAIDQQTKFAQDLKKAIDQINKQINDFDKPIKKPSPKSTPKKSTPRTLRKPIPKKKPSPKPKPPTTPKTKPRPRPKPPTKPKPKAKPKIKLSLDSKTPKGYRHAFDIRIRRKGKAQTIKAGLPLNKAFNKLGKALDNSLGRSAELVLVGLTKQKDVSKNKKLASKFRLKKQNSKVLKTVEFRKFGLDTKGEKKGISLAKALAPKRKKKQTTKKKKSTTKKKKLTKKTKKR